MQIQKNLKTAAERVRENKDRILKLWCAVCEKTLPVTQKSSRPKLIDSLPDFLDKLAEALSPSEPLAQANADNVIAPKHGLQRVQMDDYSLKTVMQEYELLHFVVRDILQQTGGYSPSEYEVLTMSMWQAAREAAFAYATTMENKRSEELKQFELLVQEVTDYAIFMLDPTGHISSWNEGAHRIKQYEAHEVLGRHFRMLYRPEDQKAGRPEYNITCTLKEGRHNDQWWRMKKDGTFFWASVSMTAIYEGNRLIGYGKVVHDLTEKKKADESLEKAKVAAEEANLLKSAFLANMSHEIRTPLSAMLGFTEVLKSTDLDESEKKRYIEIIDRNGRMLVNLIDDILDISKVEAGKLVIEKMPFDIRHLISEVAGLFEIHAEEKGLEFYLQIKSTVPQQVVSDPIRVRQILNNIIGNAVKFTKKGYITVSVEQLKSEGSKLLIQITVRDTGRGIPHEQRKHLFEAFMQADPSTTRLYGGTGLGLALSRKLAHHLGGDVILAEEEEPEKGSTFVILIENSLDELPSSVSKKIASLKQQPTDAHVAQQATPPPAVAELRGRKLLVVEDMEDNQILIQKLLSKTGAEVTMANDGAEGVEKALQGNFDLVIMDVQMPVLDGNDAARKLRGAGYKKPMIALTAHAMREEVQKSLEAGFNDHISKPIDARLLLTAISNLLHTPSPAPELQGGP